MLVRAYGFSYRHMDDLVNKEPLTELFERFNIIEAKGHKPRLIKALTGVVNKPSLRVRAALQEYFDLTKDRLVGKSEDFIRKWKNPRTRAVNHFIEAIEDKPIGEITRGDINAFRAWWMKKIDKDKMNPGTASKDMIHLKDVLRVTTGHNEIDLDVNALFLSAKFKNVRSSRVPFEAAFVQNEILKPGKLDTLNTEAKALIYIMADTGARVSEVVGLLPEDIFLDDKIPFIWIRPNSKRTLKNRPSERQIPLVGAALKGAGMIRNGFPRYDAADSVSNLVNQYMSENGLKPSPMHTLYSLRHTFKDRLRDAAAPEEVIDELMGHAGHRPRYGRGHTVETKYEWLKKVAFKV
jgi:integrase